MRDGPGQSGEFTLSQVPRDATYSGWHIALVVIGGTISIPGFLMAAQIGSSLGLKQAAIAFVIGSFVLGLLGAATGAAGQKSGLAALMLGQFAFGRIGGRAASLAIALSLVGWFGVISSIFAIAAQGLAESVFGVSVPASRGCDTKTPPLPGQGEPLTLRQDVTWVPSGTWALALTASAADARQKERERSGTLDGVGMVSNSGFSGQAALGLQNLESGGAKGVPLIRRKTTSPARDQRKDQRTEQLIDRKSSTSAPRSTRRSRPRLASRRRRSARGSGSL